MNNGLNFCSSCRIPLAFSLVLSSRLASYALIFLSSLSTKEDVTDVSGRGIGMDAVKDMIDKMGGEIKVHSTYSKGTKFEIIIPG